jgi:NAD-dependent DNA ligase
MGRKRMKIIFENIPDFNIKSESELRPLIEELDGFSSKTADKIIDGISEYNEYKKYYEKMYGTFSDNTEIDIQSNKLEGFVFCFSGVRSKETEELILSNGGEISNSFTKKTTHLIVKDISKSTSKTKKALSQNKTVMELSEFEDLLI